MIQAMAETCNTGDLFTQQIHLNDITGYDDVFL